MAEPEGPMGEHPHRRAIAAGIAALLLGLVIALIVAGGDDDRPPGEETTKRTAPAEAETRTQTETAPAAPETETTPTPPRPGDRAAIQQAVVVLIESAEVNNAAGVCQALGQPEGSGPDAAEACAEAAGIDLSQLPGSDELSFESVWASGDRGRVVLGTGDTVSLRRQGNSWVVTDIQI